MNRSQLVRTLLAHFPALKPKEIERSLGERGVSVDANLIGVARLRRRRTKEDELALCSLLAKLLKERPDLLDMLEASFDAITQQVFKTAASYPGLSADDLADKLAAEIPKLPPPKSITARVSRSFLRVLDQQPHYRKSFELISGTTLDRVLGVVVRGEGLSDDLTDEQIEALVVRYIDEHYPAGPTAEAIAGAYLDRLAEKVKQGHEERRAATQTEQVRADRILATVLDRLGSQAADRDGALAATRLFLGECADWPDEEIAERLVAGIRLLKERPEKSKIVADIRI